ncbi:MAG: glycosyltransferase family 2 protein [Deltaproteobacteria bacterium]|nr:glycosyltransferase family 2 protein [Deltaproteobacteria bacterium]
MSQDSKRPLYVIAPAYNEAEGIDSFVMALGKVLSDEASLGKLAPTIIIVDDGSKDQTSAKVAEAARMLPQGVRVVTLRLSRNFGHQAALQAGLDYAVQFADVQSYYITLDADFEHPPTLIPEIVRQLDLGIHHVQMVRHENLQRKPFKRLSSWLFYWIFDKLSQTVIPVGAADFRGFSNQVAVQFVKLPEHDRFHRGLFHWLGFPTIEIRYESPLRRRGKTKFSISRMLELAVSGLTSFSERPLTIMLGIITTSAFAVCLLYLGWEVFRYFHGIRFVVGWPTMIFFISFWGGANAASQLVVGVYLTRMFSEIKARPVYICQEISSFGTAGGGRDKGGVSE